MKRKRQYLGQHFLHDAGMASRIVEAFAPGPADTVLEIGPGRAALTRHLAERVAKLYAVEVDHRLAADLAAEFRGNPRVEIVRADILRVDWSRFSPAGGRFRVIGNLPYSISKPLLRVFTEQAARFSDAVVTLQEEVAQRLVASPGNHEYGAMTLLVSVRLGVEALFRIPPGSFSPPPEVRSRVVRLVPRAAPAVQVPDEKILVDIIHRAFSQRRKTLANALKSLAPRALPREALLQRIRDAGLDPEVRPETIDLEGYASLARTLTAPILNV